MSKIILTGDRPTGKLHVGHYVGSLRRRVELQNSGEYDKIFIMIADAQALTDNAENPEKVRQKCGGGCLRLYGMRIGSSKIHIAYSISDSTVVRVVVLLYEFGHSVSSAAQSYRKGGDSDA